jgi:hypothetical protein
MKIPANQAGNTNNGVKGVKKTGKIDTFRKRLSDDGGPKRTG